MHMYLFPLRLYSGRAFIKSTRARETAKITENTCIPHSHLLLLKCLKKRRRNPPT